jgi:hypothetical protein
MAARAAGLAADVTPRVHARFESSDPVGSPGPDEVGVAEPTTRSPSPIPAPLATLVPRPSHDDAVAPAVERQAQHRQAQVAPADPLTIPAPAHVALERGSPTLRVEHERVEFDTATTPTTGRAPASAVLVSVQPAASAAAQAPPAARAQPHDVTQRGPDVIRVAIGRVDVQAPAAQPRPAPSPPAPPAATAERMTLQEYLRGERGTG